MDIKTLLNTQLQLVDGFDKQFQKGVKNVLLAGGGRRDLKRVAKTVIGSKVKQGINLGVRWINENQGAA